MMRGSISASTPVFLLSLLLWLVAGWLSWANWRRGRGRGRGVAAMETLRFLIMTLIAFTLLRPELVRRMVQTEPPEIVILTDASESMKTRDVVLDPSNVLPRDEWIEQSRATNFWRPLEKSAKVRVEEFAKPPTNAALAGVEVGTDLNQALENVWQEQKHLKAVLVLSDGDWNLGQSPLHAATRFRSQGVPLYTVTVGSDRALPDLVLQEVTAPSYGLLGEQISLPFKIQSSLPREVKTTISLSSASGVEARKDLTLPAYATVQDSVVWFPRRLGEYTLTLRMPVQPEEYLSDNNEQTFRISIRTEKLNVLLVDSLPRWEYRYLRNALSRDPGVSLDCLLFHPGLGVGQGSNYISAFPETRELAAKYDVVFLGDVGLGESELSAKDLDLVKGLVDQQGSGLVFLPGARGRQLTFLTHPIRDLLPVVYDEKKPDGISVANEANLLLTGSGKEHFLTMLTAEENRNEEIWKSLPGFYWCAAVQKSRPGSEVLAVHSAIRNAGGRLPMLVTRSSGNGEVLFMGTDSAWRWRRGVEDKYHYRFWGQVVRWMSHKRHMAQGEGIRLAFSPENPQVGENLFLQATLLDLDRAATEKERLTATVVAPSGKTERLEFASAEGGWGVFKGNFMPREGGNYKIKVATERAGHHLETDLLVAKPQREKLGQPANPGLLREIAALTRGSSGTIQDLGKIVEQISLLPESEPVEKRLRLWANPWWGGLILLLLAIYWIARKVAGLV